MAKRNIQTPEQKAPVEIEKATIETKSQPKMIKVKFIKTLANPDGCYSTGRVVELESELALRLINEEICIIEE